MIEYSTNSIFNITVDAIVNPVNVVGIMGAGLARNFKINYPENFLAYQNACNFGDIDIGKVFVFEIDKNSIPRYIINFPTKKHWRNSAKISYITDGLLDLAKVIQSLEIKSIAIPQLGCGLGGLPWIEVKQIIINYLDKIQDVKVILFE